MVMLCVLCPPGDQAKIPPGEEGDAVSITDCPEQMVSEFTVTTGAGLTVTVALAVDADGQPGSV